MKRLAIFFALALTTTLSAHAQFRTGYSELNDSETVGALKSHVSYIASAAREGRKAGSDGEAETAAYIHDVLEGYGVEMLCGQGGDLFGLHQESGDTLLSRNVIGYVQGFDKKLREHYIVVGARMDNLGKIEVMVDGETSEKIYFGANGNASGLAMLLELARLAGTNSILFRRSVIFIAFGASREAYAGAWYFLNRSFGDSGNIDAMINLDMLGTGADSFLAYTASNPDMNRILEKVSGSLQPVRPTLTASEPYPSDHRAFYSKSIPSVFFTTGKYPEYGTERDREDILDWEGMESELEFIYNFTLTLCNTEVAPSFGQSHDGKRSVTDRSYSYYDCDQKPTFLGHADPKFFLQKWVYQYLKYPYAAQSAGIQGRVMVEFTIDRNGKVKDAKVAKSVDPLLDEEALKVVSASPDWKPGRVKGEKVDSYLTLPIEFKLTKKSNKSFGIKK